MPETQAKSGGPGASATPVDGEPKKDGAAATGREAAGRAAVPADAPSPPKFTRAPGMAPPPGEPTADGDGQAEREAAGRPSGRGEGIGHRADRHQGQGQRARGARPSRPVRAHGGGTAPGQARPRPRSAPARRPKRPGGWRQPARFGRGGRRPGVRGGPLGPLDGLVGGGPRSSPGPAEPQADRPLVRDEVRLRRLGRPLHRRGRGHLGAVPRPGRHGRLGRGQHEPAEPGERQRRHRAPAPAAASASPPGASSAPRC